MLTGMARSFEPSMAFGFEGEIEYELTRAATGNGDGAHGDRWTIRVDGARASLVPGPGADPAVRVRMQLVDFVRIAAGESPASAFFDGRVDIQGDLSVARRLAEMFGGQSPY